MNIRQMVSLLAIAVPSLLLARPSGYIVMQGNVQSEVKDNGLYMHVSDKAVLNWQDFSSEKGELVQFIQPSLHSVVINRVIGGNISELQGDLKANGQVFLINPNGILIGADAVINTGAFVASTLDALDRDMLRKKEIAFKGSSQESIVNLGTIKTTSGDIILLALRVENSGDLQAPHGDVLMGIGGELILKPDGAQRIFIAAAGVEAQTAENPYSMAFRHEGSIEATELSYAMKEPT